MRLRERGRQAHRAQARRQVGRADRELQGRRAREIRARLPEPRALLPAPDLLLGDRLRPDRAERRARRLRPDGAGHRRLHGADRRGRRRADPRRRAGVGHLHRRLFGDRDPGGAAAARAHRQGRLCRHRAGRLHRRRARQPGDELPRFRRGAEAHRQCASEHRALSGVSGGGRPHHHRDRQRLAIRQAVRGARRAGTGEEPRISGQQGPAEEPRQADRAPVRPDDANSSATICWRSSKRSACRPARSTISIRCSRTPR